MDHFHYDDYKAFVNLHIQRQERSRGEFTRLAAALNVSTVLISQIFKGDKDLTAEQGLKLTQYFGFNELQTKYFLTCLTYNRAGDHQLKGYYQKELKEIQARSQKISERVTSTHQLDEAQKSFYYSSWMYSAIHLSCALPFVNSVEDIAHHLRLKKDLVQEAVRFLLETGLLKKEAGQLRIGTTHIHLDNSSPYISQHHKNWRLYSSLNSSEVATGEIMYTAPMVISKKLAVEIQQNLLNFIQETVRRTVGCEDEELWNLNLDFIKMK